MTVPTMPVAPPEVMAPGLAGPTPGASANTASLAPTTQPSDVQAPAAAPQPNAVVRGVDALGRGLTKVAGAVSPDDTYTVSGAGDVIHAANQRTPGAIWRSILGNALVGLGAGARASANPEARSSPAAAFAAGVGGGAESAMGADMRKRQQAQENYEDEQRNVANKAAIAHENASTAALYFNTIKAGKQPDYNTSQQLEKELEEANIPVQTMTAPEAGQLAKVTPGFYTTHIVKPLGMEVVTGPNGEPVMGPDGKPMTQERVFVAQIPQDPQSHNIKLPAALAADVQKYGKIAGIQHPENVKAGDAFPLSNFLYLSTAVGKAKQAEMQGWVTAQSNPQKFVVWVGEGKAKQQMLMNPVTGDMRPLSPDEQMNVPNIPATSAAQAANLNAEANQKNAAADLSRAQVKSLGEMGVDPTVVKPVPNSFFLPKDDLAAQLGKQSPGGQLPPMIQQRFDALYGVAHYQAAPNTFPARVYNRPGNMNQMDEQSAVSFILRYINPNYDANNYDAVKNMEKEFASTRTSVAGGSLIAFDTATLHLGQLAQISQALNNGNVRMANQIAQNYAAGTGQPAPITFDGVKTALAGELGKTFKGAAPDIPELEAITETLNRANSPAQLVGPDGIISAYAHLMLSKAGENVSHYYAYTGHLPPQTIDPQVQAVYKSLGIDMAKSMGLPANATVNVGGTANENPEQPQQQPSSSPLANMHTNPATHQTIGWDGKNWVDSTTRKVVQ